MKLRVSVLAVVLGLTSFAGAQTIKINWRLKAPFSDLKTFSWAPNEQDTFYRQFVTHYVDQAMTKKGLTKVPLAQKPDLMVIYNFKTQDVVDAVTTSDGFGWGGGPWGGWGGYGGYGGWGMGGMGMGMGGMGDGMSTTQEHPRTIGILTIDLVETKSKEVIWRGQATEDSVAGSQKGDEEQIRKSVDKMFDKYPPKNTN